MKRKLLKLEKHYGRANMPEMLRISERQYYRLLKGSRTSPAVKALAELYLQAIQNSELMSALLNYFENEKADKKTMAGHS